RAHLMATLRRPPARRHWQAVDEALSRAAALGETAELALLRADLAAAKGHGDAARAVLDEARRRYPTRREFWIARADLEARDSRFDSALALLDEAVATLGPHVEFTQARIRLHRLRAQVADREALHELGRAADQQPLEVKLHLLRSLVDAWYALGEFVVAEQIARQIAQSDSRDVGSRFFLAEQALRRKAASEIDAAVADLRKVEGEEGYRWRWVQLAWHVDQARGQAARLATLRHELAELLRKRPDWPRVALLEARIDEIEGKWDAALRNWQKAIELGERDLHLLRQLVEYLGQRRLWANLEQIFAVCEHDTVLPPDLLRWAVDAAMAQRNEPRARLLLGQYFADPPRDYRDLLWLARHRAELGDVEQAETLLRRAVDRAEHLAETWCALVEYQARRGQRAEVAATIARMEKQLPQHRRLLALAQAWDAAGDVARAEAAFEQALRHQAADFPVVALAADFYRRAEHHARAAALYERLLEPALAAPPDAVAAARRQLAVLAHAAGDTTRALAWLDANRAAFGDQVGDQRVRWLIQGRDPQLRNQALAQLKESFLRHPSSPEEELFLVELYEAADDLGRAREQLTRLLFGCETRHLLAAQVRLLARLEAWEEARLWLDKLERWEPNSPRTQQLRQLVAAAKGKG
ncbi:MAG: hypothetical protein NZO58_06900, partial [Gemmataceae bacterium]|nr:hypothetical protein [Gemmataceae bacterium]